MGKYDDILYLDHPVSKSHKPMSIYDRSAQFAPFAALVGYEDSIKEAARKTVDKISLSIEEKEIISQKLSRLHALKNKHPLITITYFKKDNKKKGGNYLTSTLEIKTVDLIEKKLIFYKNPSISFDNILDIVILEDNEQ